MKILLAIFIMLSVGANVDWAMPQDASAAQRDDTTPRIKIGGNVAAAQLLERLQPVYPPLARQARISGTVRLHAIIGKDGYVKQLEVISGHPILVQSALDAVKKWRYAPTLLNGKAVEVDTTIDVVYALNEDSPSAATEGAAAIDPQLREDILRLLDAAHFREMSLAGTQRIQGPLRATVLKSLPDTPNRDKIADAFLRKLPEQMPTEEFVNAAVPVYAKYFSDDEIRAITKFYETPEGQKFSWALPNLMSDLGTAGMRLGLQKMPSILKQLCEEYPELEGTPDICPKGAGKKD